MHLLRFNTVDGIVYIPASRLVSIAPTRPADDGSAQACVCVDTGTGQLFNLIVASEAMELAAALESGYRACELFHIG